MKQQRDHVFRGRLVMPRIAQRIAEISDPPTFPDAPAAILPRIDSPELFCRLAAVVTVAVSLAAISGGKATANAGGSPRRGQSPDPPSRGTTGAVLFSDLVATLGRVGSLLTKGALCT